MAAAHAILSGRTFAIPLGAATASLKIMALVRLSARIMSIIATLFHTMSTETTTIPLPGRRAAQTLLSVALVMPRGSTNALLIMVMVMVLEAIRGARASLTLALWIVATGLRVGTTPGIRAAPLRRVAFVKQMRLLVRTWQDKWFANPSNI